MHPKEAEHQAQAQRQREADEHRRQLLTNMTDTHHLRFVHIRRWGLVQEQGGLEQIVLHTKGGMTLAYQLPYKGRGCVISVATALVHDNDAYCKRTGRFYAAQNFSRGEVVKLRVPKNMGASTFLKQLFTSAINGDINAK